MFALAIHLHHHRSTKLVPVCIKLVMVKFDKDWKFKVALCMKMYICIWSIFCKYAVILLKFDIRLVWGRTTGETLMLMENQIVAIWGKNIINFLAPLCDLAAEIF
jgi:hypothetical protein